MINGIKYVLWDWNGTLLDDVDINLAVVNNMLRDRGLNKSCDREFYREHFRFPVAGFYEDVGFSLENVDFDAVAADYVRWYSLLMPEAKLHDGARETLNAIAERDVSQYILSATQRDNLCEQVKYFGLSDAFDGLLGVSDSRGNGKTEVALAWLESQNLLPEEVVIVGDTDHDFAVAREIGCRCVLIANGHQTCKVLERTGAKVISSVCALVSALEEL